MDERLIPDAERSQLGFNVALRTGKAKAEAIHVVEDNCCNLNVWGSSPQAFPVEQLMVQTPLMVPRRR